MWRVVIWSKASGLVCGNSTEFDTKEAAYVWANEHYDTHAIEIYGPDGYYDCAEA